ncbi:hypothetical protein D3C73_1346510 [compost metagenome]
MTGDHFPQNVDQIIQLVELDAHEVSLLNATVHGNRRRGFVRVNNRLHRQRSGFPTARTGKTFTQPRIRRRQLVIPCADKKLSQLV